MLAFRMSDALTIGRCPASGASRGPVFGAFQRHAQRLHELVDLDWLGEIPEESRVESLPDVARYGIGAECDDGDVGRDGILAEDFSGLRTVQPGRLVVIRIKSGLRAPGVWKPSRGVPRVVKAISEKAFGNSANEG